MGFESSDLRKLEGEIQNGPVLNGPQDKDPRKGTPYNFLHVTLISVKQVLAKHLGIATSGIEYVFTENVKQNWKLKQKIEYPRSHILFRSLEVNREKSNARAAKTGGYAARKDAESKTSNSISVASVFPVTLSLSYHYFDNDEARLLKVMETLAIMAATGSGAYQVKIRGTHLHQSRLDFSGSIEVPQLELGLDINPESAELVAEFTVSTFLGSIYDVARNHNIKVDEPLGAANIGINIVDSFGNPI